MKIASPFKGLTRRTWLTGVAGLGLLPLLPGASRAYQASYKLLPLRAAPAAAPLSGKGKAAAKVWAYGEHVPGPEFRIPQGGELAVRIDNALAEPTTVHWHGIRIANAMDGVPHMTQPPVAPGASFEYRFTVPDAGTFWYHPHQNSSEQVARGLFGVLVVEELEPPLVDRDLVLVITDWRLGGDGQIVENFGAPHDRGHAGRLGNTLTVNGELLPEIGVWRNERLRLRLLNTSTARVVSVRLEGAAPKLIAIDGQPIHPDNGYGEGLLLAPGNRADLIWDVTAGLGEVLTLADVREKRVELATFKVAADEPRRVAPLVAPIALKPNPLAEPDLKSMRKVELVMSGGAKDEHDRSNMLADGPLWQFNGVAIDEHDAHGMGAPLFTAKLGETIALKIINFTAWAHAMHIHGHHFKVISHSANIAPKPYWWDTIMMERQETVTIAMVADNPGKWMIHCHMLDHQAAGMMTWFEVT